MAARFLPIFALFIAMHMASATDPNQIEDFCVATKNINDAVLVQGELCKNPSEVTVDDFVLRGMPDNRLVDPSNLPGLNTLSISLYQFNLSAGEVIPPHYHPRGTELITLLEGTVEVGLVSFNITTNAAKHFSQTLSVGDAFVISQGMLHFVQNVGDSNAVSVGSFSSQNPSSVFAPTALFKTKPPISVDLLSKAFKLDPEIVKDLQS